MSLAYGHALLTCDASARDPNGKLTLYGIFDRIWVDRLPATYSMFVVYFRCAAPGPGRVAVRILKPDMSVLSDLEAIDTDKSGWHTVQGTYTLGGVELPSEGEYRVVLAFDGEEILWSNLHVQQRTPK